MNNSDDDTVHLDTPPKGRGVCCAGRFCKNPYRSYYASYKCIDCEGHPHEQGCFTLGEQIGRYDKNDPLCLLCEFKQKEDDRLRPIRERCKLLAKARKEKKEKLKKKTPFTVAALAFTKKYAPKGTK
jgi:hypothetical protein